MPRSRSTERSVAAGSTSLPPNTRIAFTWEREPGIPSHVRIELAPCVSGIRVVVTESGGRAGHRMLAAGSRLGSGSALARLQATFMLVAA